jgi:hypothetical protein
MKLKRIKKGEPGYVAGEDRVAVVRVPRSRRRTPTYTKDELDGRLRRFEEAKEEAIKRWDVKIALAQEMLDAYRAL